MRCATGSRSSTTARSSPATPRRTSSARRGWSGGDSSEGGDRPAHGPPVPSRPQPPEHRRPRVPARDRGEPRAVLVDLRSLPPAPRDCGVRVHLPGVLPGAGRGDLPEPVYADAGPAPGAPPGGPKPERPRGDGRARRDDGRILAQRPLVDGEPALLGEGDRQPATLHDGPDEPDGPPRRHGDRRDVHDVGASAVDPPGRHCRVRRHLLRRESVSAPRRVLLHPHRTLPAGHDVRIPVAPLGSRGVEPLGPHGGADFLLERDVLPGGRAVLRPHLGARRRDRGQYRPCDLRAGFGAPADVSRDRAAAAPSAGDGIGDLARPGRRVPDPRALHAGLSRDPREEGGEADITASVSTFWRTFKVAAWLGWEMDSNWTEPWLFIIYSIVKPIAAVFILVLMYVVFAAIGNIRPQPLFDFMYVGNAFFIFVGSTLFGTFQVIQW